ncbi:hypothetical protein M569_14684 [Genlisea aurea]|uniref:Uncharacterized protein n=1 Tax=Genlisea aurea TaxID=192259 RepID=S8C6S7_9LAMI|nr:hypothetical protein M569_14684 [Genlisea aurea]
MIGVSLQGVVDFAVAAISLMLGLGLFAFIAAVLGSAAFWMNVKEEPNPNPSSSIQCSVRIFIRIKISGCSGVTPDGRVHGSSVNLK